MREETIDTEKYLDPVFLRHGQRVYTYDLVERIREDNLGRKKDGRRIFNMCPQAGFQEKVLTTQADIKIVGGKRGGGKEMPLYTRIVTPYGYRALGDLEVGDTIIDPCTGGFEKVIQIFEHHSHDVFELILDDGSTTRCGHDHLWKARMTGYIHKDRRYNGRGLDADWRIWTFDMIKAWLDKKQSGAYPGKHLVIPVTEPVKFTCTGNAMRRNDLDPYVLGAIIGDGCITESIRRSYTASLCSADPEIINRVADSGIDMTHFRNAPSGPLMDYYIKDQRLEEIISGCGLSGCDSSSKFIPYRYKFATVDERWALLQGLMDTDGYVSETGRCSYATVSRRLADDVKFLVESLGGIAKIKVKRAGYKKDGAYIPCKDCYDIHIKMPHSERMFHLKRKKERCTEFNHGVSQITRRIIGYRYVGKEDTRCITVDSPNRLYLCDDFIVTHNTYVGLYEFLPYIFNPDVNGYGFRKYEDDIARGIWKSSKQVYRWLGSPADTSFEWKFLNGRGATMKMEHLQDPKKIADRFRGVEMAFVLIEELAEHTRDDLDVIFDLLASNRTTSGVRPKFICTCNPVGKSNKLRLLLDWWIDPDTNRAIPERDGKVRYFYRYGKDVSEMVWGDTPEEVYNNATVHTKIDNLCISTGSSYKDFITSITFINGEFKDNKILQISDPKYMSRISAKGGEGVVNDIEGIWQDMDSGTSMLSAEDMSRLFDNTERRDGFMRASADVALTGDFFVIFAFDGHHIADMEAWRGVPTDAVETFVGRFLDKNGVRQENFTYDSNGLGLWLKDAFPSAVPFNNKSQSSNTLLWNNLKSECAEKFVKDVKSGLFSIDSRILQRRFTDSKGRSFTVADRLVEERRAIRRKDSDGGRFEIISKPQMKAEIGHSPDFIEALFMVEHLYAIKRRCVRTGFENW